MDRIDKLGSDASVLENRFTQTADVSRDSEADRAPASLAAIEKKLLPCSYQTKFVRAAYKANTKQRHDFDSVKGFVFNLSLSQKHRSTVCIGPVLVSLLHSGANSYSLEIVNPEGIDIKLDTKSISNAKHLVIDNINHDSIVELDGLLRLARSTEKRPGGGFPLKVVVDDKERFSSHYSLKNTSVKYLRAKKAINVINLPDHGSQEFYEREFDNFKLRFKRFHDDKVEFEFIGNDGVHRHYHLTDFKPQLDLPDQGIKIKYLGSHRFADGLNSTELVFEDANLAPDIDGHFRGLAAVYDGFEEVEVPVNHGAIVNLYDDGDDESKFIVGPYICYVSNLRRQPDSPYKYDIEILSADHKAKTIKVNGRNIHKAKHVLLKDLTKSSLIELDDGITLKPVQDESRINSDDSSISFEIDKPSHCSIMQGRRFARNAFMVANRVMAFCPFVSKQKIKSFGVNCDKFNISFVSRGENSISFYVNPYAHLNIPSRRITLSNAQQHYVFKELGLKFTLFDHYKFDDKHSFSSIRITDISEHL